MKNRPSFVQFLLALVPMLFFGCGGGGGGGDSDAATGEVFISLTDAPADEIERFEVDLVSLQLVKRNGARVETLPLTTRVDLGDLVELAEILTAASVPNGVYTEAKLTLDFAKAAVHLAGAAEDADLLEEDGDPLAGTLTVDLIFDSKRRLVVAPGLPRMLTLDFDLDASTEVDAGANTVKVSPVLFVDMDLQRPHVRRVRGPLESVDVGRSRFVLAVRPFRAAASKFGRVFVATGPDTVFEIQGLPFKGSAGISAMAALPALSAVVAVGEFVPGGGGLFAASEVLAGSSVPGGSLDVARGLVTARSGTSVTLLGAELDRSGGSITFNASVKVELDPARTRVTRQFSAAVLNTDAISVGQKIVAFGVLSGSPGSFVLDPAERVRLVGTELTGEVKGLPVGALTLKVQRIGRRRVDAFDFSGTGPAGSEADPKNYEVDTGALPLSGLSAGTPVRILGFVTPFGSAPPDFEAVTIVNLADVRAFLAVTWQSTSDSQFKRVDASGLVLDLSDAADVHHVERGGALTDLLPFPSVTVIPKESALGRYALKEGTILTVFGDFADFAAGLSSRLGAGESARRIRAAGRFEDASGQLKASDVSVVLRSP